MIIFEELDTRLTNFSKFLKTKNKKYGKSSLEPVGVFSEGNPNTLLLVRIDDKLSKIQIISSLK